MSSQVQICNIALNKISQGTITSINEDTAQAIILKNLWDHTRDRCLRAHNWNFAVKRQTLSQLTATPAFEYSYYFQLPSDFLRELSLYQNCYPYKVEGDRIATSASSINLIYIARITDTEKWDPLFTDYFSSVLAEDMARAFTGSESTAESLAQKAEKKLKLAKRVDAQHGSVDIKPISTGLTDTYIDIPPIFPEGY